MTKSDYELIAKTLRAHYAVRGQWSNEPKRDLDTEVQLTCLAGHTFWRKKQRGRPPKWCAEHRPVDDKVKMSTPAQTPPRSTSVLDSIPGLKELIEQEKKETLICESCGKEWQRDSKRGRKPRECPDCIGLGITRAVPREKSTDHQRELIRNILSGPSARSCSCGLSEDSSPAEIRSLNGGCSSPHHVCSTLDTVRRTIGA